MARPNPNSRPHLYEVTREDEEAHRDDEYRGVGTILRQARNRRREDIGHVAETLRIRRAYLEALEAGHYEELPGPTYTVGFLRTYGDYLELDVEDLVERYKMEGQHPRTSQALDFPTPTQEGQMPKVVVVVLALVLAVGVYVGWQLFFDGGGRMADRVPEVPSSLLSKIDPATPAPSPDAEGEPAASGPSGPATPAPAYEPPSPASAPPEQASADQPETPPAAPQSQSGEAEVAQAESPGPAPVERAEGEAEAATDIPVAAAPTDEPAVENAATSATGPGRVVISASADSWVEIRDASGAILLSEIMRAGDEYVVPDDAEGATLVTGNAGALTLSVDGMALPPLGPVGAVRRGVSLAPDDLRAAQNG